MILLVFLAQTPTAAPLLADPVPLELFKWVLAVCGSVFVGWLAFRWQERSAGLKDHSRLHEALADDLREINIKLEIHHEFIEPLRMVAQQNMVSALLKTNPFTPIENEAAQRIMSMALHSSPNRPYQSADTGDLLIVKSGCLRIIKEADERPFVAHGTQKEMDQMVYAGVLSGIEHELALRKNEVELEEIAERRRQRSEGRHAH